MISERAFKKIINLKNYFPKLDDKGGLLIPMNLKLKDIDFMKYRHLPVNWEIKPVTKEELPFEFSTRTVMLIDLFRRKTIDLDYEVMILFDYNTGELLYCFVNDSGQSNEVYGSVNPEIFVGKHVASIHNHPKGYSSALSSENFQILELEFEDYELVSSWDSLWVLKSKKILDGKNVAEIKKSITELYKYSESQNDSNDSLYEELLLEYINNCDFNISLSRRYL